MDNYLTENIDTVIFDIGNVLIHFAWKDYLRDLGYDGAMFDRVRRLRKISAKCSKDLARPLSRIR